MASKRTGGSNVNGRDSCGKRLGAKHFQGEIVHAGSVLVRQRGMCLKPGINVGVGSDDTLFAKATGTVKFGYSKGGFRRVSIIVANN